MEIPNPSVLLSEVWRVKLPVETLEGVVDICTKSAVECAVVIPPFLSIAPQLAIVWMIQTGTPLFGTFPNPLVKKFVSTFFFIFKV